MGAQQHTSRCFRSVTFPEQLNFDVQVRFHYFPEHTGIDNLVIVQCSSVIWNVGHDFLLLFNAAHTCLQRRI